MKRRALLGFGAGLAGLAATPLLKAQKPAPLLRAQDPCFGSQSRMRILIAALALSFCAQAAAQQMFKCKDAAGKITYAGNECAKLGLKPAGEIQERSSVAPAYKPPASAARQKPATTGKPPTPAAQLGSAAPAAREKRCFTVKTATGMATRCNEVPAEETK